MVEIIGYRQANSNFAAAGYAMILTYIILQLEKAFEHFYPSIGSLNKIIVPHKTMIKHIKYKNRES